MSDLGAEVARFLAGLPGVRSAVGLPSGASGEVLSVEEGYERDAALPVENIGVRCALACPWTVAVLKDASFRPPPTATVYLVEDAPAEAGQEIRVAGRTYHVIGEETAAPAWSMSADVVAVSDTFAIYPDRRTDPGRPSRFLLPPVAFPELNSPPWADRLRGVLSASPSTLGDAAVRRICGFDGDPALATLLVGFAAAG